MHNIDGPTQYCYDHQYHSNQHQYPNNCENHTTFCAISNVARVARAGKTPLCVSALCIMMTVVITHLTFVNICRKNASKKQVQGISGTTDCRLSNLFLMLAYLKYQRKGSGIYPLFCVCLISNILEIMDNAISSPSFGMFFAIY